MKRRKITLFIFSDNYYYTQYIVWVPSPLLCPSFLFMYCCSHKQKSYIYDCDVHTSYIQQCPLGVKPQFQLWCSHTHIWLCSNPKSSDRDIGELETVQLPGSNIRVTRTAFGTCGDFMFVRQLLNLGLHRTRFKVRTKQWGKTILMQFFTH